MANLLLDRTVRLAVTGLSGAGKTVFITSVLHNLLSAAHAPATLPLLGVKARGSLVAARIVPDASLSRKLFPYAEAIAAMAGDPPAWPEGTKDISQIRIAIRYRPEGLVGRQLGLATLNLDIVDYPGEWLIDLPMLDQDFAEWSAAMLALCREEPRRSLAADWLGFVQGLSPDAPADEAKAREAAALYTTFLHRCREPRHGLSLVQPGRFVLPGEYEGAPILWFCPLEGPAGEPPAPGSLRALMAARYDAYRRAIVRRFYREHFRTFDRQVVLVDVLKALDGGRHAFEDARAALTAILGSFRFGKAPGWLAPILGSRIDRVLFAATKADHVTPDQYANLRSLLAEMMAAPSLEMRFAGGQVAVRALASVRSTEIGRGRIGGKELGMVRGVPVGETEARLLHPGKVPPTPPAPGHWDDPPAEFPDFRPPPISAAPIAGIPHIGLDETLEFLIGDKFR